MTAWPSATSTAITVPGIGRDHRPARPGGGLRGGRLQRGLLAHRPGVAVAAQPQRVPGRRDRVAAGSARPRSPSARDPARTHPQRPRSPRPPARRRRRPPARSRPGRGRGPRPARCRRRSSARPSRPARRPATRPARRTGRRRSRTVPAPPGQHRRGGEDVGRRAGRDQGPQRGGPTSPVSSRPARTSGSASSARRNPMLVPTPSTTVAARAASSRAQRLGPVGAVRDHLGQHRVVVAAHHAARGDPGVDPHARRASSARGRGRRSAGSRGRVLGVDPGLDRVPAGLPPGLATAPAPRPPPAAAVPPGPGRDHLGDRVLDLQPGVHLHEEELIRPVAADDELHRAGADVADARAASTAAAPIAARCVVSRAAATAPPR